MILKSKPLAIIIVVVLFGGILFSTAMGWWQTESSKDAALITEGEFAGMPNPADIRGSYSFGDVERNFDVPAATLLKAFGAPEDTNPDVFKAKDLETLYADQEFEIGTASLRLFVALYTGLPYEMDEEVYLPKRAVEMLKSQATLTDEQIAYLGAHAVAVGPGLASVPQAEDSSSAAEGETETEPQAEAPSPAEEAEHVEGEGVTDGQIKGKTTFKDLLDWGVSQEVIEEIIGGEMPNPLTVVKTHCDTQGLYFGDIKTAIQAEIDKVYP